MGENRHPAGLASLIRIRVRILGLLWGDYESGWFTRLAHRLDIGSRGGVHCYRTGQDVAYRHAVSPGTDHRSMYLRQAVI